MFGVTGGELSVVLKVKVGLIFFENTFSLCFLLGHLHNVDKVLSKF